MNNIKLVNMGSFYWRRGSDKMGNFSSAKSFFQRWFAKKVLQKTRMVPKKLVHIYSTKYVFL